MPVGSVLELYTSVLAWNLYGAIWALLVNTGLVLLPFIVVAIDTLLDTRDSPIEITSDGLMRIMETRIYTMLFVVFFAAQPMIYVHLSKTVYSFYRCETTASGVLEKTVTEKTFGDSGSTLDKKTAAYSAMLDGKTPEAPLWWYLITKLNQAITQATKQELPCQADLRMMASGLAELDIPDRTLKDELGDFYRSCWQPAVNQFGRERLPESELPTKFKDGEIYNDINWPGSEFFLNRAGYYDTLRSPIELSPEHFPYNETRDSIKMPPPPSGVEMGGYPTCYEWWLGYPPTGSTFGTDHGLRTRLLGNLKDNGASTECTDCAGSWFNFWAEDKFSSSEDRDNTLIKTALFNTKSSMELNLGHGLSGGGDGIGSDATNAMETAAAFIGAAIQTVPDAIETEGYRKIAPAIQSVVLLLFITVLPLLMTIGTFSLGNLVSLSILQFSIIFWGFLFAFAAWLDNFLLDSLLSFGDDGRTLVGYVLPDSVHNPDAMAISWVVRMCYYLLPLMFTIFLGAVGVKAGSNLNSTLAKSGQGAANQGSKGASNLALKLVK